MRAWITWVALVLLVLIGCARQGEVPEPTGQDEGRAPATAAQEPDDDAASGNQEQADEVVRVGLTDWTIEIGGAGFPPGKVTIVVTNAGGTEHDLLIRGTHGVWGTPYLAPGETYEMDITTARGETLELECTVAGHRSAGMHTEARVADSRAA